MQSTLDTAPYAPVDAQVLRRAADRIASADALVVAAGAGMGVDSGLPDFRGDAGFWQAYPALGRAGLSFARVACPQTFEDDPHLAWGFYGHRLALYRRSVPHAGFDVLRRWADHMPHGAFVFTSNVDGQFQRAGFEASALWECHGSIHWLQCTRPCGDAIWSADTLELAVDAAACRLLGPLPRCPHCAAVARPNILMFGDGAWLDGVQVRQRAHWRRWFAGVRQPVIVELGAGSAVRTVREFGERLSASGAATLVRINPRESEVVSIGDVGLATGALAGLQALDALLQRR